MKLKKKDEVLVTNIYPIYYGKKPKISLEDILKKSVFNENEIKYSGICLSDWLQMNLCLFTKKKEWENEKEWRIVLDSSYKNNLQKMPYLTSIILGERISKQNKNKLLKIAKEKNIDVYERKINITCSDVIVNKIYEARKY